MSTSTDPRAKLIKSLLAEESALQKDYLWRAGRIRKQIEGLQEQALEESIERLATGAE